MLFACVTDSERLAGGAPIWAFGADRSLVIIVAIHRDTGIIFKDSEVRGTAAEAICSSIAGVARIGTI